MKRLGAAGLIVLFFCFCLLSADVFAASSLRGDVNGDGKVNLADATLINQILLGKPININYDWPVNLAELMYVLQIVSGLRQNVPVISGLANYSLAENTASAPIAFTVGNVSTDTMVISAVSSNQALVANSNLKLGGSDFNRTLIITPQTGKIGTARITLTVTNGQTSVSGSFNLTVIDVSGPVGSLTISGGVNRTKEDLVTMVLSATDISGVTQMQFSNDGSAWSEPEAYAAAKLWTLPPEDGNKTIYAKFGDSLGHWSSVYTATVILDTTVPVTTASLAAGTYNSDQSVSLSANELAKIYYTTDGMTPTESSSIYSSPIKITATTTLKFFAKDLAGNAESIKSQAYFIDIKAVYEKYFLDHPKIAEASINKHGEETAGYFWSDIEELETTGKVTVAKPAQLGNWAVGQMTDRVILTELEVKKVIAAKTAHAVWLDKNKLVPWRLDSYTAEELTELFDESSFFDFLGQDVLFLSVVDYWPYGVYDYMVGNDLIKVDQFSSLLAVAEDLRSDDTKTSFIHGGADREAYSLLSALTTWIDLGYTKFRVSRQGCATMSRIMVGMLRSINIPGKVSYIYSLPGHAGADWPSLKIVLADGDDLYDGLFSATPTAEMFPAYDFYQDPQNTAVCGSDKICLSGRYRAQTFIAYPSNWLGEAYCHSQNYGFKSCEDFISISQPPNNIFEPYLTPAELQTALDLCRLCPAR